MEDKIGNRKPAVVVVISLAALLAGCSGAKNDADPEILFFYRDGCDRCARMEDVLNSLLSSAPGLKAAYYEIVANEAMLPKLRRRYGLGTESYEAPEIFVGRTAIVGAGRAQELSLGKAIEASAAGNCLSPLKQGTITLPHASAAPLTRAHIGSSACPQTGWHL